ncbi:MAG: PIN domain-containing protein [Thermoanaerobaculia bacterium]
MSSTSVADPAPQFVDANVLIYSFDRTASRKREQALALLDELWRGRLGCLSLQVLAEFFVSVTRKLPRPLTSSEAAAKVADFAEWNLHEPERADLLSAIALHQRLDISFWDAMVIQSARRLGCRTLWTEDLNDGQVYAGVTARNPFAAGRR